MDEVKTLRTRGMARYTDQVILNAGREQNRRHVVRPMSGLAQIRDPRCPIYE
jgi:hypothetical protein